MKNKKLIIIFIIIAMLCILGIKMFGSKKQVSNSTNANAVQIVQQDDSSNKALIDLLENKTGGSNIGEQSKELVNSKYNFAMKYSDDWYEVSNASEGYKLPENVEVIGLVNGVNPMNYISVVLEKPYGKIDAQTYLNETRQVLLNKYKDCQIIKEKEILVSGKKAYGRILQFSTANMVVTQYQVYVEGSKGIYIITYSSQSDSFEDNYQSFLDSLNTIQVK